MYSLTPDTSERERERERESCTAWPGWAKVKPRNLFSKKAGRVNCFTPPDVYNSRTEARTTMKEAATLTDAETSWSREAFCKKVIG